jgi:hypothetical protein
MTRAYGVPVASTGRPPTDDTGELQGRRTRGRPNWWVILAVSLALIALLVETSGRSNNGRPLRVQTAANTRTPVTDETTTPTRSDTPATTSSTTTPTSTPPVSASASLAAQRPSSDAHETADAAIPPTTTTTSRPSPTTTTTTNAPVALPATRSQTEGYFDPPQNTSGGYTISGTGPTEVSVLWSVPVYLSMTVVCPGGSQTVGGTTAMELSLPDATGCQATVSEPSSESTSLSYTFATGPANG